MKILSLGIGSVTAGEARKRAKAVGVSQLADGYRSLWGACILEHHPGPALPLMRSCCGLKLLLIMLFMCLGLSIPKSSSSS